MGKLDVIHGRTGEPASKIDWPGHRLYYTNKKSYFSSTIFENLVCLTPFCLRWRKVVFLAMTHIHFLNHDGHKSPHIFNCKCPSKDRMDSQIGFASNVYCDVWHLQTKYTIFYLCPYFLSQTHYQIVQGLLTRFIHI